MSNLDDPFLIRRFQPEDAPGITRLVRQVYGEAYRIHPDLYDPPALVRENESGELVSVVALNPAGVVVGHYALERPGLGKLAESGEAMVAPESQHHGLLEKMRVLLEAEAHRLELAAIFGECVTTHVFSQKAVERFGELPCGLVLGVLPKSFHAVNNPLNQRMSVVLYLKYLQRLERVHAFLPARHEKILHRIYSQFGVTPEPGDFTRQASGQGRLEVDYQPDLQSALIQVSRVDNDTAGELSQRKRDLCRQGVEMIMVTLPLAQVGTPGVAEDLESEGFFFCGVTPFHFPDGDALRLQYLADDLDPTQVQLLNPFAGELLEYVHQEFCRVGSRNR